MEELIMHHCESKDLEIYEKAYNLETKSGKPSDSTTFNYASFLVRSKYPADIKKGIYLLEELYKGKAVSGKRDFVYFIAIGYARLKEYDSAIHFAEGLLKTEPGNRQVTALRDHIAKLKKSELKKDAAVTGGILLAVGGIVGLGLTLLAKK